jgi:hypothetical protein
MKCSSARARVVCTTILITINNLKFPHGVRESTYSQELFQINSTSIQSTLEMIDSILNCIILCDKVEQPNGQSEQRAFKDLTEQETKKSKLNSVRGTEFLVEGGKR